MVPSNPKTHPLPFPRSLTRRRRISLTLWGIVFLFTGASLGLSSPLDPETAVFDFAQHLLTQGDYLQAATEFKRFLFLSPNGPRADQAAYLLGQAWLFNRSFQEAVRHWEETLGRRPNTPFRSAIQLGLAQAYWLLGQEGKALSLWQTVSQEGNPPFSEQASRSLLWALVKNNDLAQAEMRLSHLPLQEAEKEIHRDYFRRARELPYASPETAGLLAAILPGAGHWYLGRKQDGAIALAVNGLFTWAALSTFQEGNKGLGTLLAVVELAWYAGNIYSAVNSAHKLNQKLNHDFLEQYGLRFGMLSSGPKQPTTYFLTVGRSF